MSEAAFWLRIGMQYILAVVRIMLSITLDFTVKMKYNISNRSFRYREGYHAENIYQIF